MILHWRRRCWARRTIQRRRCLSALPFATPHPIAFAGRSPRGLAAVTRVARRLEHLLVASGTNFDRRGTVH
jgi:hypothetical protein